MMSNNPTDVALPRFKVLIVDDMPSNIQLLAQILMNNYTVQVATNGKDALALIQGNDRPDLILLDIMMPEMDGYEVCRRVKKNPVTRDIPIIFVTAKNSIPDQEEGFRLGAIDYITKPIERPLVDARVSAHAKLRNQSKLLFEKIQQVDQANSALTESNARLSLFIDTLPDVVYIQDGEGRWQVINSVAVKLFGFQNIPWQNKTHAELALLLPEFKLAHKNWAATDQAAWNQAGLYISHEAIIGPDQRAHTFEVRKMPVFDDEGNSKALMVIGRDITEHLQAQASMKALSLAIDQGSDSIIITDQTGLVEYVNDGYLKRTGYTDNEVVGRTANFITANKTAKDNFEDRLFMLQAGEVWHGELNDRRKDGSEFLDIAVISPIRSATGETSHFLSIQRALDEKRTLDRKNVNPRILQLANFDALTGLGNRHQLLEKLTSSLKQAQLNSQLCALFLIDIDRFKRLNDAKGQDFGDALLIAVGERLKNALSAGSTLVRMASDEFALLIVDISSDKDKGSAAALAYAEDIKSAFKLPFDIIGEELSISISIGVAAYPESDEEAPQDILRRANTALHSAKETGGDCAALFDVEMGNTAQHNLLIEIDLRRGIACGELILFLQPQVDAKGEINGAEALVRWQHPDRGLVAPNVFIPVAESSNLIIDIGEWVTKQVCTILKRRRELGRPLCVSVNISPRHFRQTSFVQWVQDILRETHCDAHDLKFEITESLVLDDLDASIEKMNQLCAIGIRFSIDDFGTGYSSLAYLKRLPVSEIKIDRAFIKDLPTDSTDAALVNAILSFAKHMDLDVVAEGVETLEQAAYLNKQGSVIHQGYYFGRPELAKDWLSNLDQQFLDDSNRIEL